MGQHRGGPAGCGGDFLNDRLLGYAWEFVLSVAERDQSDAAIGSLSGRTAWWAYGIEQLMHHPFTGLGLTRPDVLLSSVNLELALRP